MRRRFTRDAAGYPRRVDSSIEDDHQNGCQNGDGGGRLIMPGRDTRGRDMPGPAVLYVLALLLIAAAAGHGAMQQGTLEEALASLTRRTARIAFVFFFVAFTASVWLTWQPNCFTRWLMRNRQHVGLSFATVHFVLWRCCRCCLWCATRCRTR
jgi:hypothetical protein